MELKQHYENYTAEDQAVWKILFERQIKILPGAATSEFMKGIPKVAFTAEAIPDFEATNKLLQGLTGWSLAAVPGIVNDELFFDLMSNRRFPATTWLRKMSQLDYLEEPDMFHDVFAHVPLLSNQLFADFLQSLSRIGQPYVGNPYAIELLSRIYWYSVEFGLIRENGALRIYGAGILSSAGETAYCLSDKPMHLPYSVAAILDTPYRKDTFQDTYFMIESYEQLYDSLPEITALLATKVGNFEASNKIL